MATKSFYQLGRMLVGSASNLTLRADVDAMAAGEIQAFAADGTAAAEGKPFVIYQKTADGIEKTGIIDPAKVVRTISKDTVAKVQKTITLPAFASVTVGETYGAQIRVYNVGSLSTENFYILDAYVVATAAINTPTLVMAEIATLLNASQTREGKSWFTISAAAGVLTVAASELSHVPATKPVRDLQFDGITKEGDVGVGSSTTTVDYVKGIGDGADMADIEQNLRFHNGDQYGDNAFPNQYYTPTYIVEATDYDVVHITYNGGRADHVVENQRNEIIIAVDSTLTVAEVNTQLIGSINAFLPADKDLDALT